MEIEANYDRSISLFFQILQAVYVYSIVSFFIYSYLILSHWFAFDKHLPIHATYLDGTVGGIFPAFFFYSRYQSDMAYAYAFTNILFSTLGTLISLYLWIKFDEKAQY